VDTDDLGVDPDSSFLRGAGGRDQENWDAFEPMDEAMAEREEEQPPPPDDDLMMEEEEEADKEAPRSGGWDGVGGMAIIRWLTWRDPLADGRRYSEAEIARDAGDSGRASKRLRASLDLSEADKMAGETVSRPRSRTVKGHGRLSESSGVMLRHGRRRSFGAGSRWTRRGCRWTRTSAVTRSRCPWRRSHRWGWSRRR
jgi:hypothetical protein